MIPILKSFLETDVCNLYCVETGYYYLMSRYYDPAIGAFITPDNPEYLEPETIGGLNLFVYCYNNPVMYVAGYLSYNQQLKGLSHSWSKERENYRTSTQGKDIKDKYPNVKFELHHPYGHFGSKKSIYYPMTIADHKAIHKQYGYGKGRGGYFQPYPFYNWWNQLKNILGIG